MWVILAQLGLLGFADGLQRRSGTTWDHFMADAMDEFDCVEADHQRALLRSILNSHAGLVSAAAEQPGEVH